MGVVEESLLGRMANVPVWLAVINIAIMIYVFLLVLLFSARYARWEDQRASGQAQTVERYRHQYRAKISEVATADELRRLDRLWDFRERSPEDWRFWTELATRWGNANPAEHPSQHEMRSRGWLCRCSPAGVHACRPSSGVLPAKGATGRTNLFTRLFVGPLLTPRKAAEQPLAMPAGRAKRR
jgi:hypothetical protein